MTAYVLKLLLKFPEELRQQLIKLNQGSNEMYNQLNSTSILTTLLTKINRITSSKQKTKYGTAIPTGL